MQSSRQEAARPGAVLAGKFQVEKVIGVGGMGLVVAAHHLALGQRVALKLMHPEISGKADLAARFVREARAAARVRSEHLVRVLDAATLEDGTPYIVMELLDGIDLATLLRQHGPVPPPAAATLVLQVCEAIAEAHALGIVHRDLKPANLFITSRRNGQPLVKVLDLGVCKLVDDGSDLGATSTATVFGTPAYMAPEQMKSSKLADTRSDIWSLGIILHEMVSGERPFSARTYAELCLRAALDPYQPFEAAPELAAVVARCLEKDAGRRFQTVEALMEALAPHAGPVHLPPLAAQGGHSVAPTVVATDHTPDPSALIDGSSGGEEPLAHARSVAPRPVASRRRALRVAAWLGGGVALLALAVMERPGAAPPSEVREALSPAAATPPRAASSSSDGAGSAAAATDPPPPPPSSATPSGSQNAASSRPPAPPRARSASSAAPGAPPSSPPRQRSSQRTFEGSSSPPATSRPVVAPNVDLLANPD